MSSGRFVIQAALSIAGVILICIVIAGLFVPAGQAQQEAFTHGRNVTVSAMTPETPVKIKLKRQADGQYAWEITGDNVEEVIAADARLKEYVTVAVTTKKKQ